MVARWSKRDPKKESDRSAQHFFVPVADIRENKYDLSLNRYKDTKHEEATYEKPLVILARMKNLKKNIFSDIDELEGMLK